MTRSAVRVVRWNRHSIVVSKQVRIRGASHVQVVLPNSKEFPPELFVLTLIMPSRCVPLRLNSAVKVVAESITVCVPSASPPKSVAGMSIFGGQKRWTPRRGVGLDRRRNIRTENHALAGTKASRVIGI